MGPREVVKPALSNWGVASQIEVRLGQGVLDAFLGNLESGDFTLDYGEDDLPRVRELIGRYNNLPLGYADAVVAACAERHGGRVLTYDVRRFAALAREGIIQVQS